MHKFFSKYTPSSVGRLGVILFLLQACMNPNSSSSSGQSIASQPLSTDWCSNLQELPELFRAIIKRRIRDVQFYLMEDRVDLSERHRVELENGSIILTPLSLAVELGYKEIVELLIEKTGLEKIEVYLQIEKRKSYKHSVLSHAIQLVKFPSVARGGNFCSPASLDHLEEERLPIFKTLVEALARRGKLDKEMLDQALCYAVLCLDTKRENREGSTNNTRLSQVIRALLDKGAKPSPAVYTFAEPRQWSGYEKDMIDTYQKTGNTILHIAIYKNDPELFAMLLDSLSAADIAVVNAKNKRRNTPLQLAIQTEQFENAGLLIKKGANDVQVCIQRTQDFVKKCQNLENTSLAFKKAVAEVEQFLERYQDTAHSIFKKDVSQESQEQDYKDLNSNVRLAYFQAFLDADIPMTALHTLCEELEPIADQQKNVKNYKYTIECWQYIRKLKASRPKQAHH